MRTNLLNFHYSQSEDLESNESALTQVNKEKSEKQRLPGESVHALIGTFTNVTLLLVEANNTVSNQSPTIRSIACSL